VGYLLADVMHFYGTGLAELMAMPVSAFWELSRNADRIRARQDRRQFNLLGALFSEPREFVEHLDKTMGQVVDGEEEPELDRAALGRLKQLFERANET
jgi:hypothetical protein